MKKILVLFLIFLPALAFGQGRIFDQLKLKSNTYYNESNNYIRDSIWRFNQTVAYDDPRSIDEESWTRLIIEIRDTNIFLTRKKLDIRKDALFINCYFNNWNVWLANRDSTSVSGNINLISLSEKNITLGLDVIVENLKNKNIFVYRGERTFVRTNTIQEFYKY